MKLPKTALKRLIEEQVESSQQATELYSKFRASMEQVDPDLSYRVLAEVVANLLIQEYGTHNYKPFVSDLVSRLK
jgi:hypothetical protein